MARKRRGPRSPLWGRPRRAASRAWHAAVRGWRTASGRWRPWRPQVAVDLPGRRGRRLRRSVARAAGSHLRALGVRPPAHLLVVVQRTVAAEHRPLQALLEVYENGAGERRHVLFLALAADGRALREGEVIATLRQQLQRVASDELGALALRVAAEPPRARPQSGEGTAPFPGGLEEAMPPPAHIHQNGASGAAISMLER